MIPPIRREQEDKAFIEFGATEWRYTRKQCSALILAATRHTPLRLGVVARGGCSEVPGEGVGELLSLVAFRSPQ